MTYLYDIVKEFTIKNPVFEVTNVSEVYNGFAEVEIDMHIGSVNNPTVLIKLSFPDFKTDGSHTQNDLDTWVTNKLESLEV